jgi:hypothetical protein
VSKGKQSVERSWLGSHCVANNCVVCLACDFGGSQASSGQICQCGLLHFVTAGVIQGLDKQGRASETRVRFSPSFPRLHSRSPLALHVMSIRASNESVTLVCSAACTRWRGHALREAQGTSKGGHTTAFLTCVVHSRNAQRSPPPFHRCQSTHPTWRGRSERALGPYAADRREEGGLSMGRWLTLDAALAASMAGAFECSTRFALRRVEQDCAN